MLNHRAHVRISLMKQSKKAKTAPKSNKSRSAAESANEKKATHVPSVAAVTDRLLRDIRSLQLATSEISETLSKSMTKHAEAFVAFMEEHTTTGKQDAPSISIPVGRAHEFKRLIDDLAIAVSSLPLSFRGLFLVLISKWDAYIGSILRWVYNVQPEIINSSGRSILYTELRDIGSVSAARSKIVEDEIASVLRESHAEHFSYLEKKLKIPLRENLEIWPDFVEITQRRHLIAHTDAVVSQQYLQVCADNQVTLDPKVRLGSELLIDIDYFSQSCNCLTELGVKLSQVLWRKLESDGIIEAEENLIKTTFEMIEAEQFRPAIKILTFSLAPPMKFKEARNRFVAIINLAQAYKWSGDDAECREIIKGEDWSASNVDFRLAVAVLQDDFPAASDLMKRIGLDGDIKKESYENWPLFKEFRKSNEFLDAYRNIFKTEVEVRNLPPDVKSLLSDKATNVGFAAGSVVRDLPERQNKGRAKRSRSGKIKSA
jgi:hypothetical protein